MRTYLVAALVFSCLVAASLPALPPEKDPWIELPTVHFTLYSALSRARTREIALHLEQLRAVLARLTPWNLEPAVPTYIYVFGNNTSFTPYKNWYRGKAVEGAGYFLARPDGSFIAVDGGSTREPEKLIYHEYVHHVVDNNNKKMPLWLNEGLAEFYSTFRVSGRRAEVGRPIPDHLALLQKSRAGPFAELFDLGTESTEYNEGARRGAFYAESWVLVHYLMIGYPERGDRLSRHLRLMMTDEDISETFHGLLTSSEASLTRELRSYVRSRQLPVVHTDVEDLDVSSLEVRALAYPEVLGHLGHLLLHLRRDDTAAEHFAAALEFQPGNALALAGLADLAQRQERHAEAQALFARALEAVDDAAAGPEFASARVLLNKVRRTLLNTGLRQVGTLLERQRPEDALRLLDRLRDEASPEDRLRVEDQMREIRSKIEGNRWTQRYNEALRLAQSGDRESARSLLKELVAVSDGSQAEAARTLLEKISDENKLEAVMQQMNRLLARGRSEEAIELLRRVDVPADSSQGRWIEEQITRIHGKIARSRFNDRFNEAMGHLEAGDAPAACRVLERLLATLPKASPEAQRARILLAKARVKLKRSGG